LAGLWQLPQDSACMPLLATENLYVILFLWNGEIFISFFCQMSLKLTRHCSVLFCSCSAILWWTTTRQRILTTAGDAKILLVWWSTGSASVFWIRDVLFHHITTYIRTACHCHGMLLNTPARFQVLGVKGPRTGLQSARIAMETEAGFPKMLCNDPDCMLYLGFCMSMELISWITSLRNAKVQDLLPKLCAILHGFPNLVLY
jgi:hypothetical protein